MAEWRKPDELVKRMPKEGIPVMLIADFGGGEVETEGRAYTYDGGHLVFADRGGWCTSYVKRWKFK